MKNIIKFSLYILIIICISAPAHAYLDPGTGSILLQAIVAGIAAAFTTLVFYWKKLKFFLKELFRKNNTTEKKKK